MSILRGKIWHYLLCTLAMGGLFLILPADILGAQFTKGVPTVAIGGGAKDGNYSEINARRSFFEVTTKLSDPNPNITVECETRAIDLGARVRIDGGTWRSCAPGNRTISFTNVNMGQPDPKYNGQLKSVEVEVEKINGEGHQPFQIYTSGDAKVSYRRDSNRTSPSFNPDDAFAFFPDENYSFNFQPECDWTNQTVYLKWSDADVGRNQTNNLRWILEKKPKAGGSWQEVKRMQGEVELGSADNSVRSYGFTAQRNYEYNWRWENVSRGNAFRMLLPFSENALMHDIDCRGVPQFNADAFTDNQNGTPNGPADYNVAPTVEPGRVLEFDSGYTYTGDDADSVDFKAMEKDARVHFVVTGNIPASEIEIEHISKDQNNNYDYPKRSNEQNENGGCSPYDGTDCLKYFSWRIDKQDADGNHEAGARIRIKDTAPDGRICVKTFVGHPGDEGAQVSSSRFWCYRIRSFNFQNDLTISKTGSTGNKKPGEIVYGQVEVRNTGAATGRDIAIQDMIPFNVDPTTLRNVTLTFTRSNGTQETRNCGINFPAFFVALGDEPARCWASTNNPGVVYGRYGSASNQLYEQTAGAPVGPYTPALVQAVFNEMPDGTSALLTWEGQVKPRTSVSIYRVPGAANSYTMCSNATNWTNLKACEGIAADEYQGVFSPGRV